MRTKMILITGMAILSLFTLSGFAQTSTIGVHRTEEAIVAHFQWVMQEMSNSKSKQVLVAAHRGDWRNAPENSIQALTNSMNKGVDIVEIDLKRSKDGQLVLMHDRTIDRTTNGKGNVDDFTLDSLKTFYLSSGYGVNSQHRIPTFEEYMLAAKGKMFICIDKCYPYLDQVLQILEKTGTSDQVLINGEGTLAVNRKDYQHKIDHINFKPVVMLNDSNGDLHAMEYLNGIHPKVMELVFQSDTCRLVRDYKVITGHGTKLWYNALWASLCGGHQDDLAVENNNPAQSWQWLIEHGATIIQTDRPVLLLQYLKDTGARIP